MIRNALLLGAAFLWHHAAADCLADETLNGIFKDVNGGEEIPLEGSCCQSDVCAIPCPEEVSDPAVGYGIAVGVSIAISFAVGMATIFIVHGQAVNFFVAGHSLPLWIVAMTLGAQSVDSNALLGNADLSYKFHFWDGAALPIGLGMSLVMNGLFLAKHINGERVLTLPDVLARRYGKVVEVLMSLTTIASFLFLLAGNLVGMGKILSYLWDISESGSVWMCALIVWAYTVSGGLFSVAYTDVVQGLIGWTGCLVAVYWAIANEDPAAPPPSIGLPGYIYPDNIGDGGVCDMYNGVECTWNAGSCCYNEALWCPSADNCTTDNGAYPVGDKRVFSDQMGDYRSLSPFPNALLWNWATILILMFGNLGALDFQARCMAAKTPSAARWGCFIGACLSFFIGIPFAYTGAIQRVYYGPDSIHAEFDADTCSTILGLPTCAAWVPDDLAFIKYLTHQVPDVIGGWCLIGIVAASMSTADGAILAIGTVFSHNLMRQLDACFPSLVTGDNLLRVTRLSTLPFTLIAACIAAYYKSDDKSTGGTGYLLIVAFDIVLATVVVPLFGCFYAKTPRPNAALCSFIVGASLRIILEFVLPKDGFLLLPYEVPEFLDYGPAASDNFPAWIDADPDAVPTAWDPDDPAQKCNQEYFEDYTGVDSLAAFAASILVFLTVQFLEHRNGGPLFDLGPAMVGYDKNLEEEEEPVGKVLEDESGEGNVSVNKAVAADETSQISNEDSGGNKDDDEPEVEA